MGELLELICPREYEQYNVKLAQELGLEQAVYMSQLLNIFNKSIYKGLVDDNNFFKVSRSYIKSRTTFTTAKQRELDEALSKNDLLQVDPNDNNKIKLNIRQITTNLLVEDKEIIAEIQDKANSKRKEVKETQTQIKIDKLKTFVKSDNEKIRAALEDWVEGVYSNPNGFLSKKSIQLFQQKLDEFAGNDNRLKIDIINVATINGYRDCVWAINAWKKDYAQDFNKHRPKNNNITLSDEVF